ncbi:MAG: SpoIIE family protein phosphatase [Brevinematales bacterium]|nr:SpoIIE family protein phosphatase [Brevinematales bacterium]
MIANYFYYEMKRTFKLVYSISISLVFLSATFNFVAFFTDYWGIQIVDILAILSVISLLILMDVSFKKNYLIHITLSFLSILFVILFTVFGIYSAVIFDGVFLGDLVYILMLVVIFLVIRDIVLGMVNKEENYLKSESHLGYKQLLVGFLALFLMFLLKIIFGFSVRSSWGFVFHSIVFLIVILTLLYSRMNYVFFLKNKLVEDNNRFLTLYRSVVDEIIVGKEIIDRLLPNKKSVKGLEFDKYFKPAVLVGGDFLDIIPLSESKFISYIADVSGHGVSAGIIVSMLKALLLKEVVEGYSSLTSVVRNLNADFNSLIKDTGRYSTLFITLIDKNRKKFQYVSCGHTDCLYWSSSLNEFFVLSSTAPILGLLSKIDVYSSEIDFNQNDYLILLSDGLFSISDKDGNIFSIDDMMRILYKYISLDIMPNELMFKVSQEVESFMNNGMVIDDISMLFIKL